MTRLVFVQRLRFHKHLPRTFFVAVWRRVRGRIGPPPSLWGRELAESWKAIEGRQ